MLKIASLLAALLISFPTLAHDWLIRDDDQGTVTEVDSINVQDRVDFTDTTVFPYGQVLFKDEHNGHKWGSILRGQSVECITYPTGIVQGKILDGPSVPLDTTQNAANGGNRFVTYTYPHRRYALFGSGAENPNGFIGLNQTWNDRRSTLGCSGGNALDPWSMVFASPAFAVGFDLQVPCNLAADRKLHVEFWGEDGSKIGHRDLIGVEPEKCGFNAPISLSFVSTVPVAAISTWQENVAGVRWFAVHVGDPVTPPDPPPPDPVPVPLTLEERVCRLENHVGIGCE